MVDASRLDQLEPGADIDQDRAPRDERSEDEVAEGLVLGDDLAKLLEGDLNDAAAIANDRREVEALADDEAQFAQEPAGSVNGDDAILGAEALNDRRCSRLDDEEFAALIAGTEKTSPGSTSRTWPSSRNRSI